MQSLLFQLCVEVNKVGAHALPRPTLQEVLQACLNQALQKYHSLIQHPRDKVNPFASYEEKQTKKNSILYINMLHINVQLLCKHQKHMPSIKGPQNSLYMNSCTVTSNGNRLCLFNLWSALLVHTRCSFFECLWLNFNQYYQGYSCCYNKTFYKFTQIESILGWRIC